MDRKPVIHPIIRTLREKRIDEGLTQAELAESMGYEQTTVHVWERGKARPSWLSLLDWCDALKFELTVRPRG